MSLSKLYTRASLRSFIRELSKEVSEDKVQDPAVNGIIDMNTLDLCEMLNGATQPDYGATSVLGDASTHWSTSERSCTWLESTKTLSDAGHGLTNADVGKRVIIFYASGGTYDSPTGVLMAASEIATVPTTGTFTIVHSLDGNMGASTYVVLSRQSTTSLDLSALKLDKIIKLVDSVNRLIPLKPAFDIENVINLSHNVSSGAYGYHEGETIYLVKGSSVTWGTLTLHYYRLPILPASDTDYIDVKDKYIRLLVDKCVIDVFALASLNAPSQAVQSVENRTQGIRQLNQTKEESLRTKQR